MRLTSIFCVLILGACGRTAAPGGGLTTGGAQDANQTPTGAATDTQTSGGPKFHPDGYAAAEVHGPATNLQMDGDCRECHGETLDGGTSGVNCDDCHVEGWRTDCTYCHGGTFDATGAPPRDMDGQSDPALISFGAHFEHVSGTSHAPYDCTECHNKATDVLTPGHLFDDPTVGAAEVTFAAGLSPSTTYNAGTCSDVYCHGSGLEVGEVTDRQSLDCTSCHPDASSGSWDGMSGRHSLHLDRGYACAECHADVIDTSDNLADGALHADGRVELSFPSGLTWDAGSRSCDGDCHHGHSGDDW